MGHALGLTKALIRRLRASPLMTSSTALCVLMGSDTTLTLTTDVAKALDLTKKSSLL